MKAINIAFGLICLLLVGCGDAATGTYRAQVEQVGSTTRDDKGYSLADYQQKLIDQPRVIELLGQGRFVTREGDRIVWEGVWRRETDALILRAQTVNGVQVTEQLQDDVRFGFRDGRIYDERMVNTYGLRLVYIKP